MQEVCIGGSRLHVMRDDLYPVSGGGNKGRKLERIFSLLPTGCEAIITTGGTQSNHARVCAIMAAEKGIQAHLVLHGSAAELVDPGGNLLIAQLMGARIYIVAADRIADTIKEVSRTLESKGMRFHVVPGGGHCLAGGLAYADAVVDLDMLPDVIVLASGTGATQAGILAGLDRLDATTRVVGISIARGHEAGQAYVTESYREIRASLGLNGLPERSVEFDDRWTFGGYGKTHPALLEMIVAVGQRTGLVLDPTYTGKAFFALLYLLRSGEIDGGASVMFWHTGGMLNALASSELKGALRQ